MRFQITLELDEKYINKDKNRIIMSMIKFCLSKFDLDLYQELYSSGGAKQKEFSFAAYMRDCIFHREVIEVPNQEMVVTFSFYNIALGIRFYNVFMNGKDVPYKYREEVTLTIRRVKIMEEKNIIEEKVIFKSQSPCVAREHNHDNSKTWYHSLSTEVGQKQFLINLKTQAKLKFPSKEEVNILQLKVLKNKEVKVKHYGIEVLGNLAVFELTGKAYLLDYFYKSGAGSLKSAGFGLLTKYDEVLP